VITVVQTDGQLAQKMQLEGRMEGGRKGSEEEGSLEKANRVAA
jgi:hypothetical protein